MSTPKFTVIEGNLLINPLEAGGEFAYAEVTNTRLMGVMGLHICRNQGDVNFHQFFYIDTEEYGLDDYQSFLDISQEYVDKKKLDLFGALGGDWHSITEKESLFLIKRYSHINTRHKLPLPEGIEEYGPILATDVTLSESETTALWSKICSKIHNDYELINYFIMRMIACDNEGLLKLSAPSSDIRPVQVKSPGSLLKNEINPKSESDLSLSSHTYNCVSLIDIDRVFQLVESEITVLGDKITRFKAKNPMPISAWETSLILNQPEYVVHTNMNYPEPVSTDPDTDPENLFSRIMHSVFGTMTESSYDFGSLCMIFRKNNDHVRKKVYRLDHDTLGIVCYIYSGELVFAGNDPLQLEAIERTVTSAAALENVKIEIIGRYKFPEPVMVRFVDSDFETFSDFLDFLQSFREQ